MPESTDIIEGSLLSRAEALARPTPLPAVPGIYAFFFSGLERLVPTRDAAVRDGRALLYLGIAPSRAGSGSNLRKRLRGHLRGNASGSTLRLTLGCLLEAELGIRLRPTGRTGRLTFGEGEALLSRWLDENARLTWLAVSQPWSLEGRLIQRLSLPLNLELNAAHPFHATLSGVRRAARQRACGLPALR